MMQDYDALNDNKQVARKQTLEKCIKEQDIHTAEQIKNIHTTRKRTTRHITKQPKKEI